jgi:uncharacterized protein (TIGR03086 family)
MAALTAAPGLLEHAVSYTLASAGQVTPQLLPQPTPCEKWDLRTLLLHVTDSLNVLAEAMRAGHIALGPPPPHEPTADADPLAALRHQARALLGTCAAAGAEERLVAIADRELTTSMVTAAGAIEIAVHGWDISVACGIRRPIPPALAAELLPVAPLLIPRATRAGLFADPVPVPQASCPSDRLVAFLGRQPRPADST